MVAADKVLVIVAFGMFSGRPTPCGGPTDG